MKVRRKAKNRISFSSLIVYTGVFVLLVVLVSLGYKAPEQAQPTAATVATSSNVNLPVIEQPTVDNVVAVTIAATVAQAAELAVAPNVSDLSGSVQVSNSLLQSDISTASRPQLVELTTASRAILSYTVLAGDNLDTIAARFGVSTQTIRWANGLADNTVSEGRVLQIPPIDGVIYTTRTGDTVASIASRYKADASRIVVYNDLESSGITPGLKLVLPGGVLPTAERPEYMARAGYDVGYSAGWGGQTWFIRRGTPMYEGNKYSPGYCTAYVYDRRAELGRPIGPFWGHAASWAVSARGAGFTVNRSPSVGAIVQNGGGLGHVAIVEEILENGDLRLSEMNAAVPGGGWNIVSGRILPAASVGQYLYIH